jgi:trk system potassium uptake protein TrkA
VKIVIVGCGRVGAAAAELWDTAGHEVIVLDVVTRAFERLPSTFGGSAIRGDGTDEDVLRRVGAEGADLLVALTEGDNRNVMSAQLALEALGIGRVVAKINDPLRAAAYAELGIATLCRTGLMVGALNGHLGFPPSGLSGLLAPTTPHPKGAHGRHVDPPGSKSAPTAPGATGTDAEVTAAPGAAVEA